ncbi:alpha/beta hydrolase domain-containing protein [Rhodococcus koreensis]
MASNVGSAVAGVTSKPMDAPQTKVEGPITGGRRGHIFGGFLGDLGEYGYVEEEYFISGWASSFKSSGELSEDGRWTVVPDQTAPYKTRVVVHRPKDPSQFNGTVLCEWANVSTFNDLSVAVNERFHKSGYVYAAISAQKMGIDGLDSEPATGLRKWDEDRYGSLNIPGDGFSYDIFTQVARALAVPKSRSGIDPLPGLKVRHSIATGESQSAARLATYINAVHPLTNFFAGFIPCVLVGGGSELHNPEIIPGESMVDYNKRFSKRIVKCVIRDDLDVPILVLLSENEARNFRVPPQPDSSGLRVWEVAGSVHGSACDTGYRPDVSERDGIKDFMTGTSKMVRFMPIMEAVGVAMVRWVDGGAPLARQPRLLRGKDVRTIEVDVHGNAIGGVRLPEIAVPTATFETMTSPASGVRTEFSVEKLRTLYPSDEMYLNRVKAAATECELRDVLLPNCVAEYIEKAGSGPIQQG